MCRGFQVNNWHMCVSPCRREFQKNHREEWLNCLRNAFQASWLSFVAGRALWWRVLLGYVRCMGFALLPQSSEFSSKRAQRSSSISREECKHATLCGRHRQLTHQRRNTVLWSSKMSCQMITFISLFWQHYVARPAQQSTLCHQIATHGECL